MYRQIREKRSEKRVSGTGEIPIQFYRGEVDSDIGTFGRRMFGSIFHIAVLRGLREVRCREPDTGIVRQSRSRNAENGYAASVADDGLHRFRHREFFSEVASKLRDCDRARMGNRQSTHDFGYGALQQQAREIAAGILRTEYNIQNGRFLTEYKESSPDAKQHVSLPGTGTVTKKRETKRRLRHSRPVSGKRAAIKM